MRDSALSRWLAVAAIAVLSAMGCTHARVARTPERFEGAVEVNGNGARYDGIQLDSADPDGRWFAVSQKPEACDPRPLSWNDPCPEGAIRRWFKPEGGTAFRIDFFGGRDRTGRHVAYARDGRLWLRDVSDDSERELRGALMQPLFANGPALSVAFDASSTQLAYVRRERGHTRAVVHRLADGVEIEIAPPRGEVGYVAFDSGPELLTLIGLDRDTNGDGRLSWPQIEFDHGIHRSVRAIRAIQPHGVDAPVLSVARSSGGQARELPDLLQTFGTTVLRGSGAAVVVEPFEGGASVPLTSLECPDVSILLVDPIRELVVASCPAKAHRVGIFHRDEWRWTELAAFGMSWVFLGRGPSPTVADEAERIFVVPQTAHGSSNGPVEILAGGLLDLHTLQARTLPITRVGEWRSRALVRDATSGVPFIVDVETGATFALEMLKRDDSWAQAGRWLAVDGEVVDLESAKVTGHCEGQWLTIDTRGRCLTYFPETGRPLDVDRHLQWRLRAFGRLSRSSSADRRGAG